MYVEPPAKIAVLGGGPMGLEAALYARYLGYDVDIFEAGSAAGSVLRWGHVRMFSPFGSSASPLGLAAISAQDERYVPPDAADLLTGNEWVERYLAPLAGSDLIADSLHENTKVVAVGRTGPLKGELIGDPLRAESPFCILIEDAAGRETARRADVVIDATGVFGNANWLGLGGIPAMGERRARPGIEYGIPDVLGQARERYAHRHTLLVGSGYSAATSVVALAQLADEAPQTRITWITRAPLGDAAEGPIRHIAGDRLPARDELAQAANALARHGGPVKHLAAAVVDSIHHDEQADVWQVDLSGPAAGRQTFDRVIANVGYRPDASLFDELQVNQCYATGGPMKLAAALLVSRSADCLDQTGHGPQSLLTTEPNFYILGSKSYGRNSKFLVSTGLDQIRDLFSIIAGRQDLDLYASMKGRS